jgi:hypothetical protein
VREEGRSFGGVREVFVGWWGQSLCRRRRQRQNVPFVIRDNLLRGGVPMIRYFSDLPHARRPDAFPDSLGEAVAVPYLGRGLHMVNDGRDGPDNEQTDPLCSLALRT